MVELKSALASLFLLSLLLLLSSKGGSAVVDSEVYEIDYRGPETHSSIPPPDHSRGHGKPMIRRESAVEPPKCKGLRGGCNVAENVKTP